MDDNLINTFDIIINSELYNINISKLMSENVSSLLDNRINSIEIKFKKYAYKRIASD